MNKKKDLMSIKPTKPRQDLEFSTSGINGSGGIDRLFLFSALLLICGISLKFPFHGRHFTVSRFYVGARE